MIKQKEQALKIKEKGKEVIIEPEKIEKHKFLISIALTVIAFLAVTITGLVILFLFEAYEVAMVFFVGSFLSSVFLWVLLSVWVVEKSFRSEDSKSVALEKTILMVLSVVIFICILAIFLIGNSIAWWRVRVNQLSYNIGAITIPKALTTVTTTFFSSIFLLTWSTFKETSNYIDEFDKAYKFNEHPYNIIQKREKAISSIIGNIGKKGIIFVALIGLTIVFASDLSVYATQGIIIIIPFAIGAIITQVVLMVVRKKDKLPGDDFVLDNLSRCPKCHKITALGGSYCQHCGEKLISGKRLSEGMECSKCSGVNSVESIYCRFCNAKIEKTEQDSKSSKKRSEKAITKKKHNPKVQSKPKKVRKSSAHKTKKTTTTSNTKKSADKKSSSIRKR